MALIGKIRTRSGIRFTSPADSLSIDVEAFATSGDGVSRVGFSVFPASGPGDTLERWTNSLRFPSYSSDSPLPGALPGMMAPLFCYGYTLNADEWPPGWIRIQPYIISTGATPRTYLDSIWVLNDSDGADRRGSNVTIYVHAQNGNDANSGGALNPVASLQKAIEISRKLPGGSVSSLVDMNCGGARIIAEGTFQAVRAGGSFYGHTEREWITIEAGPEGATYVGTETVLDFLSCSGVQSAVTSLNIRLVGFTMLGTIQLNPSTNANCKMSLWLDRCTMHNPHYDPAKRWSVRYRESPRDYAVWIPNGGNPQGDLWASCCHYIGVGSGPNGFKDVHDVVVDDWLGIALYCNGSVPDASATNCLFRYQRYTSPVVQGYIDATGNGNFSVSVPSAGTLRIETTGPIYQNGHTGEEVDLGTLAEIENNAYWQVELSDFGGGNDGRHYVTSAGPGFVELAVAGATATAPASSATIETWGTALISGSGNTDLPFIQLVHPDILWMGSLQGSVFTNIAGADLEQVQTLFGSNTAMSRCVIFNFSDGGHGGAANLAGSPMNECIISQCSLSGPLSLHPNTINCIITNNAWLTVSNLPTHGADGNIIDSNHTILGPAQGLHGSSGPFFKYDTSIPPFSFEPVAPWHEGAAWTYLGPAMNTYWWWPGAEVGPIGALTNVALQNWKESTDTLGASASGSSSAELSLSVLASLYATAPGASNAQLDISEKQALFGLLRGYGFATLTLGSITGVSLAGTATGTSLAVGSIAVLQGISGVATGTSSAAANLYSPGTVELSGTLPCSCVAIASITLFPKAGSDTDPVELELMKQRIHNALHALVATGAFYPCRINPQTGQMTIDDSRTVKPLSITIKEVRSSFRLARHLRTSFNVSELQSWTWMARLQFNVEVACEVFEENAIAAGIKIPPIVGVSAQRTLLARLADSDYSHPPEQSASNGTTVDFIFEVIPETLRK